MDNDFSNTGGPSGASAYGSAGASGQFDVLTFIKKPQVILRIVSLVFAIVVFGCISSHGSDNGICLLGDTASACGYAIFVGSSASIVLVIFLVFDYLFDNMSNVMHRKYVVIADILISGVWTFLYFVCFCYSVDMWNRNPKKDIFSYGKSHVEAAIAFSFFSTGTFAALVVLAVLRYRQGVSEDMSTTQPDYGYSSDQYHAPQSQFQ